MIYFSASSKNTLKKLNLSSTTDVRCLPFTSARFPVNLTTRPSPATFAKITFAAIFIQKFGNSLFKQYFWPFTSALICTLLALLIRTSAQSDALELKLKDNWTPNAMLIAATTHFRRNHGNPFSLTLSPNYHHNCIVTCTFLLNKRSFALLGTLLKPFTPSLPTESSLFSCPQLCQHRTQQEL
jgi:hypothetical protein